MREIVSPRTRQWSGEMISYMSVNGRKQGQFKGETASARRRDKWMPVVAVAMDLKSPHDAATGQISGKRQWAPVVVTKNWGAASPQGLSACAANEVLTDVVIEFMKTNIDGAEFVYQRVTLTNAVISEVRRFTSRRPDDGAAPASPLELEEWSFTFQKVEVDDADGKTSFADDWLAGA